jgi:hypothetical protein
MAVAGHSSHKRLSKPGLQLEVLSPDRPAGKFKIFNNAVLTIMSAIFGEKLTFPQERGPEIKLVVYGDEFYSRYETEEGYSAVYDRELGLFCYAFLKDGAFLSSKIPISGSPPLHLEKHLQEAGSVRLAKAEKSARRKGW